MTKSPPFTRDSLLNHPSFASLEQAVQDKFLGLLADDYLNEKGGLKRPSNGFIQFRNRFAATQLSSTNPSDAMKQSAISTLTKAGWDNLPADEKAGYNALYQADKEALQHRFPEYKYKPIPPSIWNTLTTEGQKQFWFDSVVRIANKMVHKDSSWAGSLTVETWLQTQGNNNPAYIDIVKYKEARVASKAPHASKSSRANAQPTPDAVEPVRDGHPYASARPKRSAGPQVSDRDRYETHICTLKAMLWPLGPQSTGSPGTRLVLAFIQPQELLKRVYVEEEIPRGTPDEVVNELLAGQETISVASDVIILRGFMNPPRQTETQGSPPIPTKTIGFLSEYQVTEDTLTASTPSGTHSSSPENSSSPKSLSPNTPTSNVHVGIPSSTIPSKPVPPMHEKHSYDNSSQISSARTASSLGYFVEPTGFQAAHDQVPSVPQPSRVSTQPQSIHPATSNNTGLTVPMVHTLDAHVLAPTAQNLPVTELQSLVAFNKNTNIAGRNQVAYYGDELPVQGGIWDDGSWNNANANNAQTQGLLSHNQENLAYEFGSTPLQLSQVFPETMGASGSQVNGLGEFGVNISFNDSFYHPQGYLGLGWGY